MKLYKKKAIVNLAAGESQIIVMKKAKEMGLSVIGVDRNPDAPGFKFCDECLELSTYDSKPIIQQVSVLKEKYDIRGVVNRSAGPLLSPVQNYVNTSTYPAYLPDRHKT